MKTTLKLGNSCLKDFQIIRSLFNWVIDQLRRFWQREKVVAIGQGKPLPVV